jgi:hypothetical protein
MANLLYTSFKENLMKKVLDLVNDTFNIALFSALTPTASDTTFGGLTGATESVGAGYSTGGLTLSGLSVTNSTTTAVWKSTVNPSWISATFSAAYAVIYDTAVSNYLVGVIDLGGSHSVSSGTFTITWSASPITGTILTLA